MGIFCLIGKVASLGETKLGAILFKVMTNNLLTDWKLTIKFVDDTTALEIFLGTCCSLLNLVANGINNFSSDHNMSLNPEKCEEMSVNLMHKHNFVLSPIILGNNFVDRVFIYQLLGVLSVTI